MSQPFIQPLPPDLSLYAGCVVRVTAIDPSTGNTVAGVTVSNVSLFVTNLRGDSTDALDFGPFKLVLGPEG
jgi:hypothetical protein